MISLIFSLVGFAFCRGCRGSVGMAYWNISSVLHVDECLFVHIDSLPSLMVRAWFTFSSPRMYAILVLSECISSTVSASI